MKSIWTAKERVYAWLVYVRGLNGADEDIFEMYYSNINVIQPINLGFYTSYISYGIYIYIWVYLCT